MSSTGDNRCLNHLERTSSRGKINMQASPRYAGTNWKHNRNGEEQVVISSRRRIACQPCRVRKVKCDSMRPSCGNCRGTGDHCAYLDASAAKRMLGYPSALMIRQLDQILERLSAIETMILPRGLNLEAAVEQPYFLGNFNTTSSHRRDTGYNISKDYLGVPSCNSTADSVLTWPIFQGKFPSNFLIKILLEHDSHKQDHGGYRSDEIVMPDEIQPLAGETIPSLIENFLEHVHTKNPILDVEALVRYGTRAATTGLGWDAPSCLVLLACALGFVAVPFETSESNARGPKIDTAGIKSTSTFTQETRQAEACYALACRILGLLKQTILGAQCYFYSAVYLMYTFRPLRAWNHFCQASTFYQIHSRTIAKQLPMSILDSHLNGMTITQRRLDQSLYWSCFKSECEMCIELPLPQSTIAEVNYPHLFPNPPSHPTEGSGLSQYSDDTFSFKSRTDKPSNKIIGEERSWYYYLTELALRRIGNRILNTFYRQDHHSWLHVKPLIPIAKEFEEQMLVCSSNLPPAMQYQTSHVGEYSSSRELSWAIWNRLLEMKTWLYQPFLYYAIHCNEEEAELRQNVVLQELINAAMECNVSVIEYRSRRHRHHGTWFDIRAIATASFSVIAAARSGNVKVEPEWEVRIRGVIATLAYWEAEALDLAKTRQVLEDLLLETKTLTRGR